MTNLQFFDSRMRSEGFTRIVGGLGVGPVFPSCLSCALSFSRVNIRIRGFHRVFLGCTIFFEMIGSRRQVPPNFRHATVTYNSRKVKGCHSRDDGRCLKRWSYRRQRQRILAGRHGWWFPSLEYLSNTRQFDELVDCRSWKSSQAKFSQTDTKSWQIHGEMHKQFSKSHIKKNSRLAHPLAQLNSCGDAPPLFAVWTSSPGSHQPASSVQWHDKKLRNLLHKNNKKNETQVWICSHMFTIKTSHPK